MPVATEVGFLQLKKCAPERLNNIEDAMTDEEHPETPEELRIDLLRIASDTDQNIAKLEQLMDSHDRSSLSAQIGSMLAETRADQARAIRMLNQLREESEQ